MDHLIRLDQHIVKQLEKAVKTFKKYGNIFHQRHISKRAKIICYLLLVRPIATFATQASWNINASLMELVRLFERKCLRVCLSMYRSEHSNYQKYQSNIDLYNTAGIPRIDNFIIKLTRKYYAKVTKIKNTLINNSSAIPRNWIQHMKTGYLPPQIFVQLLPCKSK